jgi:hypothetical protein
VGDKTTVVIANAKEGLQFFQCLGDGPGLDGLDLLGVGSNALIRDDVAEVGHRGFKELALGDFAIELVLPQEGEDLSNMLAVVLVVLAEDENVVNVHYDRLIEEGPEDVLDQGLKGGGGIRETKGHHLILVVSITCAEGGFLYVILVDADLVVSPPKVDLGEDFRTKEPVGEVVDERDGEPVLDRDVVKGAVVDAHTQGAILFLDEDHGGAKGGHAGFDGAVLEKAVKFFAHCIQFEGRQPIDGTPRGGVARFEGNTVVDVALGRKFEREFVREDVSEFSEQGGDARILVIDQEVTRGGEFCQEHLIMVVLGRGFEFGKGDEGYGEGEVLLRFGGRCLGRSWGNDRELHFMGAPVDQGIPLFQPRLAKDEIMVGEGNDS